MMIHNFIRMHSLFEDVFDEWFDPLEVPLDVAEVVDGDAVELKNWRDGIALKMWNAYLVELAARGIPFP